MPYFVTLHTPAPSYTLSSNERRALFVISAVAFAAIDIITAILGFYTFEMCYLLPNICLWTLFALAGFFRVCEPLFIASYITLNVYDAVGVAPSFAVTLLLVIWLLRSWIIPVIATMIVEATVSIVISPTPGLQVFSSLITNIGTLAVGLVLLWQNNRRALAEERTKEAFEAVRQTRQELARQLHDTTAKDLAHVAILAQDIAIRHPNLSEELGILVEVATSASRRLRPLILSMDTTATETPLSEVITQVSNMLSTRDITLEVNITGDIDTLTTRQQRRTAALAIRECASNILKYAPAGSEANLVIEVTTAPNLLALSLSNQIASQPQTSHMSSGYGLANLANRIRTEGGTIQTSAVDQQWITYITLPAHPSVPLETASTQTAIPKE